jgi:hypothetical protein
MGMRKVIITSTGPLGYSDSVEEYSEDALLLTSSGEVRPAYQMRENEVLVRFNGQPGTPQLWTVIRVEWVRREHV